MYLRGGKLSYLLTDVMDVLTFWLSIDFCSKLEFSSGWSSFDLSEISEVRSRLLRRTSCFGGVASNLMGETCRRFLRFTSMLFATSLRNSSSSSVSFWMINLLTLWVTSVRSGDEIFALRTFSKRGLFTGSSSSKRVAGLNVPLLRRIWKSFAEMRDIFCQPWL